MVERTSPTDILRCHSSSQGHSKPNNHDRWQGNLARINNTPTSTKRPTGTNERSGGPVAVDHDPRHKKPGVTLRMLLQLQQTNGDSCLP